MAEDFPVEPAAPARRHPVSSAFLTLLWSFAYLARYAWRNVYPLTALAAGVFFLVGVDQTREILANLVVDIRQLARLEATRVLARDVLRARDGGVGAVHLVRDAAPLEHKLSGGPRAASARAPVRALGEPGAAAPRAVRRGDDGRVQLVHLPRRGADRKLGRAARRGRRAGHLDRGVARRPRARSLDQAPRAPVSDSACPARAARARGNGRSLEQPAREHAAWPAFSRPSLRRRDARLRLAVVARPQEPQMENRGRCRHGRHRHRVDHQRRLVCARPFGSRAYRRSSSCSRRAASG